MTGARFVELLGWTLVHSLWQLTLVGAGAACLLKAVGPSRLRLQHGLAWMALLLCLLWPLATFLHLAAQPTASSPLPVPHALTAFPVVSVSVATDGALPWSHRLEFLLLRALPWIASAWAVGATLMALRLGGGWLTTRRWRQFTTPPPAPWEARLRTLAARMGLRVRVALQVSERLSTPVALGLWRPVVLVPAQVLTDLPEAYVEALLAHELAHILRRDYLFNVLQSVLEVLFFHHPTVWWLSRRIRSLREHLADDLAATAIGEPRRLALALDALDDLPAVPSPHPNLALAARGGTLFERIQHLLIPPAPKPRPAWLPTALLTLALPCAALSLNAAAEPPIPADPALIAELDRLAAQEGLDPQLLRAIAWTESGLKRTARSPRGALGVLQVMPETARKHGAADVQDPSQVMAAGARYLRFLLDRYPGDVAKAVAAYNGGHKAVDAGNLSEETRAYAPLVMSVYQAKAVQPAPFLPQGGVDGVVRTLRDGTLQVSFRVSARSGSKLEVLEDAPGGATLGTLKVGATGPGVPQEWSISTPVLRTPKPTVSTLRFRCSDLGAGISGEVRLTLDGPWKTFAFTMTPQG